MATPLLRRDVRSKQAVAQTRTPVSDHENVVFPINLGLVPTPSNTPTFVMNRYGMTRPYEDRIYRSLVSKRGLASFRVAVRETDLLVRADIPLETETRDLVLKHRMPLERYVEEHPEFVHTMVPWPQDQLAPPVVKTMITASQKAAVGPMASVAGAIADYVARDLLALSNNVIVENGGDIFMKTAFPLVAAIFAGKSPLTGKLGIQINAPGDPVAVCTSSGTLGHSLSFGRADAAVVIADSAALADAAATAIGNNVSTKHDIERAIALGKEIDGIVGIVVVLDDEIGFWGNVELVNVSEFDRPTPRTRRVAAKRID